MKTIQNNSDKYYFHKYEKFYDNLFKEVLNIQSILEIGVLNGDSIKWLSERFPNSRIVGADILKSNENWPIAKNISYIVLDQGNRISIDSALKSLDLKFDLVIEDGSHIPDHQKNSLLSIAPLMNSGSLYILEDIHTSYRELIKFKRIEKTDLTSISQFILSNLIIRKIFYRSLKIKQSLLNKRHIKKINILNLLLALEHKKSLGTKLSEQEKYAFIATGFIRKEEIDYLESHIKSIEFFHRISLPRKCWKCRGSLFNYANLKCNCGINIYNFDESMAIGILFK